MSDELDQVQPEDEVRPEEGDEVDVEAGEATPEASAQPSPDEDKARRMGWVPREDFRGDPAKWVPADEFNRRGEEQIPLLRSSVRRLEQELEAQRETARKFAEFHKRVEEDAYNRAMEQLKQQRIAARQEFDVEKEMLLEDQIAELKQQKPKPEAAAQQPQLAPEYVVWIEENAWVQDEEAYAIGTAIGEKLRKQGDTSSGREFLNKIKKAVAEKYPQLIPGMENENRQQRPAVGQAATLPRKAKKSFSDLPSDAKAACRDFVKRGFITEEQYVKDYFSGE